MTALNSMHGRYGLSRYFRNAVTKLLTRTLSFNGYSAEASVILAIYFTNKVKSSVILSLLTIILNEKPIVAFAVILMICKSVL